MNEWQPIETAPKSGMRILILEDGKYHQIAGWASFYSPFYRAKVAGWWTSSDPHQAHVTLPEDATHWMPLPTPPPVASDEAGSPPQPLKSAPSQP